MPELPEVELTRRLVSRHAVRRRIERVRVADGRALAGGRSPESFRRHLEGRRLLAARRVGKHLLLDLEGRNVLWVHLRMSGKIVVRPRLEAARHERIRLIVGDHALVLTDPRMLVRIDVGDAIEMRAKVGLDSLGPDAWTIARSGPALARALGATGVSLKVALLDQRRLAGVGNIQASEVAFRARVHPERSVRSLSRAEVGRLARALDDSLRHTIAAEEHRELRYVNERGVDERSHAPFLVYGRRGAACPRCRAAIVVVRTAGRSTYLCPRCQPRPRAG